MSERLREFVDDLRVNWDDHYWWQRHPMLQAALIALITGTISLLFVWLQTRVQHATGDIA